MDDWAIAYAACASPDMSNFMDNSEYLSIYRVCGVDADQRCKVVGKSETPELICIKEALRIVANHRRRHGQSAELFETFKEMATNVGSGAERRAIRDIKMEQCADFSGRVNRCSSSCSGPNELQTFQAESVCIVSIPRLPVLTEVHNFQQSSAGSTHFALVSRSEVWDGEACRGRG
ncbi:hypothetical protein, partial [Rhodococcus rhodochrous]|uniref:hypothetical protein n=1 Tax=Rhodococcus rhodochrous TaxID=1829 RepID=UPI0021BD7004